MVIRIFLLRHKYSKLKSCDHTRANVLEPHVLVTVQGCQSDTPDGKFLQIVQSLHVDLRKKATFEDTHLCCSKSA